MAVKKKTSRKPKKKVAKKKADKTEAPEETAAEEKATEETAESKTTAKKKTGPVMVTLLTGQTYTVAGVRFRKGIPHPVKDPELIRDLKVNSAFSVSQ